MAEILTNRIKYAVEGEGKVIAAQDKIVKSNKLLFTSLKKIHEATKPSIQSTKKLTEETKKLSIWQKILNKQYDIAYRNNRNLAGSFSVLRSKLLLAAFAVGMVSRTLGKYVTAAADVEEVMNKFNVVFGNASNEALEFAQALGLSVGRATSTLVEMMSALQDTFVPLGFTRKASSELSKAMTQLSLDVASFNNAADSDVMRAFQSAIVGNHEAVRSFGIVLTEASLKEEALKKGIIETERELTSQEKVLARVSLLFNSTKDAQGDLIRTQDSYANGVKELNENLKVLTEVIGEVLMPIAEDFVNVMGDLAKHFADTGRIKTYIAALGIFVATLSAVELGLIAVSFATKRSVQWLLV